VGSVSTSVETAGEKAYRRLRNDIIFGRLAPSQKLRLETLKDT
jgi:DNA-binding GntR family transcriptional regulator